LAFRESDPSRPVRHGQDDEDLIFYTISQRFVLGYFHSVPPGRTLSAEIRRSYVEAHWRLPDGVGPRSLPDMNSNNNALPN